MTIYLRPLLYRHGPEASRDYPTSTFTDLDWNIDSNLDSCHRPQRRPGAAFRLTEWLHIVRSTSCLIIATPQHFCCLTT